MRSKIFIVEHFGKTFSWSWFVIFVSFRGYFRSGSTERTFCTRWTSVQVSEILSNNKTTMTQLSVIPADIRQAPLHVYVWHSQLNNGNEEIETIGTPSKRYGFSSARFLSNHCWLTTLQHVQPEIYLYDIKYIEWFATHWLTCSTANTIKQTKNHLDIDKVISGCQKSSEVK